MSKIYHGIDPEQVTHVGSTETSEGAVPHLRLRSGLVLCSKVVLVRLSDGHTIHKPARRPDGSIIYMMPGGKGEEYFQ